MSELRKLPVLFYHRIGKARNSWEARLCVDPERFRAQMLHLAAIGRRACTLTECMEWLAGRRDLHEGSFLLTFDDGFLDVHSNAMPVLVELGWTATVFLVATLVGRSDVWCQAENRAWVANPLMGGDEIGEMRRRGFSFQSHTRTHPRLTTLTDLMLRDEMSGARRELEAMLNESVQVLAYPYGRTDERVFAAAADAGYVAGFTCKPGLNSPGDNPLRLRRIEVMHTDTPAQLAYKMRFGTRFGSPSQALRYYTARVAQKATARWPGLVSEEAIARLSELASSIKPPSPATAARPATGPTSQHRD
jgi:peptidoglycan/xylan/chitin deacetylase (PgdA/CDA1 family)